MNQSQAFSLAYSYLQANVCCSLSKEGGMWSVKIKELGEMYELS